MSFLSTQAQRVIKFFITGALPFIKGGGKMSPRAVHGGADMCLPFPWHPGLCASPRAVRPRGSGGVRMRPGLGAQGCGGQGDFSRTLCSGSTAAMRWRRSSCAPVLLKSGGLHSKGGCTELFFSPNFRNPGGWCPLSSPWINQALPFTLICHPGATGAPLTGQPPRADFSVLIVSKLSLHTGRYK